MFGFKWAVVRTVMAFIEYTPKLEAEVQSVASIALAIAAGVLYMFVLMGVLDRLVYASGSKFLVKHMSMPLVIYVELFPSSLTQPI